MPGIKYAKICAWSLLPGHFREVSLWYGMVSQNICNMLFEQKSVTGVKSLSLLMDAYHVLFTVYIIDYVLYMFQLINSSFLFFAFYRE